jgi:GMP synthase-like glutamine amidotransferase
MGGSGGSDTEIWAFMNAYEFSLPSKEQLLHIKAIIIPGSDLSVTDAATMPWMRVLRDFLKQVYEEHPHIKLLGICFGSQIIAEALGGKVEKMAYINNQQLPSGMFIGKEALDMIDEFVALDFVR